MGRTFFVLLVWEGNGKELKCFVDEGRNWEGKLRDFK